jgi:polysaccharide export outer membrane protein
MTQKKPVDIWPRKIYSYYLSIIFVCAVTLSSCVDSKKLAYFNNIQRDTTVVNQAVPKLFTINKNDLLQINVQSLDQQAMAVLNQINIAPPSSTDVLTDVHPQSANASGTLVDESGDIKLPLIGIVKAEGLTKQELATAITKLLIEKKIALDPIVNVRILNYKITVLGEVNHPGVIPVPNEKITLPDALGLAGDLTIYGRRDNVLLVRLEDNKIVYKRFSINNDRLFDKDLYYLQNNDLIYVEGNKTKAGLSERSTQTIPIALSALSLLAVLLTLAIRK